MTVAELIKELEKFDKDAEVMVTGEGQWYPTQINTVSASLTHGAIVISN